MPCRLPSRALAAAALLLVLTALAAAGGPGTATAEAQAGPPRAFPAVAVAGRALVVLGEGGTPAGAVLATDEPDDVVLERTVMHAADASSPELVGTRYTLASHEGTCVGTVSAEVVLEVALADMAPSFFRALVIDGCTLTGAFALALEGEHPGARWARPERDGPTEDASLDAPITGTVAGRSFVLRWRRAAEVCVVGPTRLRVGGAALHVPGTAPAMLRAGIELDGNLLLALDFGEDRVRLGWIVGARVRDARTVRWPHALDYACECC